MTEDHDWYANYRREVEGQERYAPVPFSVRTRQIAAALNLVLRYAPVNYEEEAAIKGVLQKVYDAEMFARMQDAKEKYP